MDSIGPEMQRLMRRLGSATVKAMRGSAQGAKLRAVKQSSVPVDLGQLKRSFIVTRTDGGAVLENVAPHAPYQEFGTKPFSAPLSVLLAWAERKMRGTSRKGSSKRKEDAEDLAYRAWGAIKRRGIKAKGFYAAASQDFPEIVEKELLRQLRKVTK